MQSRVDIFAEMARQQPGDAMIWYGLASEYIKLKQWSDAADALQKVVGLNPDYTAAFQLLGTALMNLGRKDEALQAWTNGIEVADRTGAWKARQHIEGLLAGARQNSESEFCKE